MRRFNRIFLLTLLVSLPSLSMGAAFVDWSGRFYVNYPDDWYHVPFSTVSIFLESQNVDPSQVDYSGVLAKKSDRGFFEGPYIFIVFHPTGKLSPGQIDSVLKSMSARGYTEVSLKSPRVVLTYNHLVLDRSLNLAAMVSYISTDVAQKVSIEFRKFYDNGIAVFLCYSPADMYESARPVFFDIVNSFSTKDIDKVAPPESTKIVDLSERQSPAGSAQNAPETGENGQSAVPVGRIWYLVALIIIVLVAVWLVRRSRKK